MSMYTYLLAQAPGKSSAVPLGVIAVGLVTIFLLLIALFVAVRCYRRVAQGTALIRNGMGGTKVTLTGMIVWPIIHRAEYMDISVKRIAIDRRNDNGLICKDNLRADIQVAYFIRVNPIEDEIHKVATSLGCQRASDEGALYELFDAKFSEALKSVGKRFDFAELYDNRLKFKQEDRKSTRLNSSHYS